VAVLGVAHQLARRGGLGAQRAAQLAHDAGYVRVQVDVLARQWRAPAVSAPVTIGLQRANPTAKQHLFELLDIALDRLCHGLKGSPSHVYLLLFAEAETRVNIQCAAISARLLNFRYRNSQRTVTLILFS